MSRGIGCHVSCAGGLENALKHGDELGVDTIQIHPSPPQRWNSKPHKEGVEDSYLQYLETSNVKHVFFHAIYLINLATPDNRRFSLAKKSLLYFLDLAKRIGAEGVIVHVGSAKDQPSIEAALERASEGVNDILADAPDGPKLLLEVAAGSGKVIGSRFEQLRTIYDEAHHQEKLGFCLDTQHMWASGYNYKNDLKKVINQLKRHFGVRRIKLIHVNDSKSDLGSNVDRHENLGKGTIGNRAISDFVNHPSLNSIPLVLETPGLKEINTAKTEVRALKKLAAA